VSNEINHAEAKFESLARRQFGEKNAFRHVERVRDLLTHK